MSKSEHEPQPNDGFRLVGNGVMIGFDDIFKAADRIEDEEARRVYRQEQVRKRVSFGLRRLFQQDFAGTELEYLFADDSPRFAEAPVADPIVSDTKN